MGRKNKGGRHPLRKMAAAAVGTWLGIGLTAYAQEKPLPLPPAEASANTSGPAVASGTIRDQNLRLVQEVTPTVPPVEPQQQQQQARPNLLGSTGIPSDLRQMMSQERAAAASGPASSAAGGQGQAQVLATTDAGDFLARSTSTSGVSAQRRSPIANEARIRGYRLGQINNWADGAFWFPARNDLDTFLSKIDSSIIRDVVVVKGPYSTRYGPGLAFIDISTNQAPRYENGFEWHGRTSSTYKFNGEQLSGRQELSVGDYNWGALVNYGQRTGNDYRMGNGEELPASYNSRDISFNIGYDFSPVSHFDFGYLRLDQTGLEFPGQIFDTRYLVTDGWRARYSLENQGWFDRWETTTYYNQTRFAGDAQTEGTTPETSTGKRKQIPQLNQANFIGFTDAKESTFGAQTAFTWGRANEVQWTVGADIRLLRQELNEFDALFGLEDCGPTPFPIPRTRNLDTGIFLENVTPVSKCLTVRAGGRVDFQSNKILKVPEDACNPALLSDLVPGLRNTGAIVPPDQLGTDYTLFLGYISAEYKLTEEVALLGGFGYANRPPTITELYALGPFLATLQQGFTTVTGNPFLNPERLHQVDLGVRADYGTFRAGFSGFYAFVNDYVTFESTGQAQGKIGLPPDILPNALSVRFVNTDLATLVGFEAYGEVDVNDWLTPYSTFTLVQGTDRSRGGRGATLDIVQGDGVTTVPVNTALFPDQEPLPNIAPPEGRLGFRLHEAGRNPTYGVDFASRIVLPQTRVALSLLEEKTDAFFVYDVRTFWQVRRGVLLTAGVENILDRYYREHLDLRTGFGVFQPGRTFYLGAEFRY